MYRIIRVMDSIFLPLKSPLKSKGALMKRFDNATILVRRGKKRSLRNAWETESGHCNTQIKVG
jgi:hypothetical protein